MVDHEYSAYTELTGHPPRYRAEIKSADIYQRKVSKSGPVSKALIGSVRRSCKRRDGAGTRAYVVIMAGESWSTGWSQLRVSSRPDDYFPFEWTERVD